MKKEKVRGNGLVVNNTTLGSKTHQQTLQNMANQAAMPPYFQWIVDKRLAICAHPFHASHIRYLLEQRIQTVISISDGHSSSIPHQSRGDLHVHTLRVPEGGAPSSQDCQQFVQRMDIARQRGEVERESEKPLCSVQRFVRPRVSLLNAFVAKVVRVY